MKKNNKGFTLIELLAVLVIMGILALIVVPRISDMVVETREELYIQDAKKLLSQAQYRMNSNSVDIDKPEYGECIVFSLKYLSLNDFHHPPNNGAYMDESSFVVVRNNEGNYQYAVLLIEARKDGLFQGVEFVTEQQLNARDSIKHVRFFDEKDIRYIDIKSSEDSGGNIVDTRFINTQLSKSGLGDSKWLEDNSIIGVYNESAMKEGLIADANVPRFTAKIDSDSSADSLGTLSAILTIAAEDADDPLNTLTVCATVQKNEDGTYPTRATNPDSCGPYGEKKYYLRNIDFAEYGFDYTDNSTAYVYITVMDPGGNSSRKLVEHQIHRNTGPKILQMNFSKRMSDDQNMPIATLQVDVHDDLSPLSDLEVCFHQDIDDMETCHGEFKPYYSYFDRSNRYDYSFVDGDGKKLTTPDGSTHTVTMFVKDSDDGVSVRSASYTIYNNVSPTIVSAQAIPDTIDGYSSLYYDVSLVLTDDFDVNDLLVKIGDEDPITYGEFLRLEKSTHVTPLHRAPGLYDGKPREIIIKVWDQFQTEDDAIFERVFITNVYSNVAPVIGDVVITSNEQICLDDARQHCFTHTDTTVGGSYDAHVSLNSSDILITDVSAFSKNVMLCVSEDREYCAESQIDHFSKYTGSIDYVFSHPAEEENRYLDDDDIRILYVALMEKESYGGEEKYYYTISRGTRYRIYYNHAPKFPSSSKFKLTSSASTTNFKSVLTDFSGVEVNDEFSTYTLSFCYTVDDSEPICTPSLDRETFLSTYGEHFTFKDDKGEDLGPYTGQVIKSYLVVTDHGGLQANSSYYLYQLHTDEEPEIRDVIVQSNSAIFNTNIMRFTVKVVDEGDTYTVCIVEDGDVCEPSDFMGFSSGKPFSGDYSGSNPSSANLNINGETRFGWSKDYEEENPDKVLRVYVKDSSGNIVEYEEPVEYTLYTSCQIGNVSSIDTTEEIKDGETEISMGYCSGKCYYEPPEESVITAKNTIESKYNRYLNYVDVNTDFYCPPTVEEFTRNCNYSSCFLPAASKNPYYIGLTVQDSFTLWTDNPEGETMPVLTEKPYCEEYKINGELYFTSDDQRCRQPDYCSNYSLLTCMDSSDGESCRARELSRCESALSTFCSNGPENSYKAVSCSSVDLSDSKYESHVCNRSFLSGYCITDDSSCYVDDPSCSGGSCPKVLSSSCHQVCYEKIDCAPETENVPAVVTCHGYLKLYRGTVRDSQVSLFDTGMRICPEVLSKYPNHYKYDASSSTPYVLFNEEEQELLMSGG